MSNAEHVALVPGEYAGSSPHGSILVQNVRACNALLVFYRLYHPYYEKLRLSICFINDLIGYAVIHKQAETVGN